MEGRNTCWGPRGELTVAKQRAVACVDLNVLEDNYRAICEQAAPGVKVLCVVKADAYGHGAVAVSRRLERNGVDYLGVATSLEGITLRKGGIESPVLVMGGILPWEDVAPFFESRLVPVVHDLAMLKRILSDAGTENAQPAIHLKFDTGMGRLGFRPSEVTEVVDLLRANPRLVVEGVMSHFASSEKQDAYGLGQIENFRRVIAAINEHGLFPPLLHMANSGAIGVYPEASFTMVRSGISLYGSYPDRALRERLRVRPVMRLVSKVATIKDFPAGSFLSYGRTFETERPSRIAYIPVGYADGYPRSLSNRGRVLIGKKECPVVGRVCMDWTLADVTDVPGVEPGDEVILLGSDGVHVITADDIAEIAQTIPYEILCKISGRITRVYL